MTFKETRKAAGLTQSALSQKSGVNIRQIQKIEAGELEIQNMTLKNAVGIAKAMNMTAETLLKIEGGA